MQLTKNIRKFKQTFSHGQLLRILILDESICVAVRGSRKHVYTKVHTSILPEGDSNDSLLVLSSVYLVYAVERSEPNAMVTKRPDIAPR